jgi:dolichol-phosphate mannosyltransferase
MQAGNMIEVPAYTSNEFCPKRNDYCVCVFVINEDGRLIRQLAGMRSVCQNVVDVVIADGGSTDGSTEHDRLKALGVNALLVKTGAGKLGSQMRMAFDWALKRGYSGVIVIDGNGKDGVEAIPLFVEELRRGVDHVQGSRFIPGGHHANTPRSRLLGLKLLHVPLMRLASGFRYTDTTNGFRAYSAKLLSSDRIALFRDCFTGYELHYYLAIQAGKQKWAISEVPVSRVYPEDGHVPTKISPVKGSLKVIKELVKTAFGGYNPR